MGTFSHNAFNIKKGNRCIKCKSHGWTLSTRPIFSRLVFLWSHSVCCIALHKCMSRLVTWCRPTVLNLAKHGATHCTHVLSLTLPSRGGAAVIPTCFQWHLPCISDSFRCLFDCGLGRFPCCVKNKEIFYLHTHFHWILKFPWHLHVK